MFVSLYPLLACVVVCVVPRFDPAPAAVDAFGVGVGVLVWLCALFDVACVAAFRFLVEPEEDAGPVAVLIPEVVRCASLLAALGFVVLASSAAALLREWEVVARCVSLAPFVCV